MKFINKDNSTDSKINPIRFFIKLAKFYTFVKIKKYLRNYKGSHNINSDKKIFLVTNDSSWVLGKIISKIKDGFLNYDIEASIIRKSDVNSSGGKYFFFDHYLPLITAYLNGSVELENSFVWFTHPRASVYPDAYSLNKLKKVKWIFCQGYIYYNMFKDYGFRNVSYHPGGVDRQFNTNEINPTTRNNVLISSKFYTRKNIDLYKSLIKLLNRYHFHIIGSGWNSLKNFENVTIYEEVNYSSYPIIYSKCNIYISLSKVEGGPLSLLEAVNFGLNVVCTETGVAGYLKDIESVSILRNEDLCELINLINLSNKQTCKNFQFLDWDHFGVDIARIVYSKIKKY